MKFELYPDAATISSEIFLDYSGQEGSEIKSVYANGNRVDVRWDKQDSKIYIPLSSLNPGSENNIAIDFSNRYTRKGRGFHRALDKSDNEIYIYTNLEPHYANEVLPLFDQPDLKARFELQATVPNKWQVISNTRETSKEDINLNSTTWHFAQTASFSTYLFFISAGPYHMWESNQAGSIPMHASFC